MDKLIKGRRPVRAKLTRIMSEITSGQSEQQPSKDTFIVHSQMLEDTFLQLQQWDRQVFEALIEIDATEEEQDKEFDTAAEYEKKYRFMKLTIEKVLYPPVTVDVCSRPPASERSWGSTFGNRKRAVQLPKIQLRKFNGDLTDWLGFWAQFQKIDEDEDIAVADKFQYLVQSMTPGSRAHEVVCSYPQSAENYSKAIKALKQRFGKEDLLVEVYVRELLKLVICNTTQNGKQAVAKMFDKLETQLRALESLGVTSEKYASMLYPLVESSLPEENLRAWQRSSLATRDGAKEDPPRSRLSLLMEFLRNEVETEERIALAKGGFGTGHFVSSMEADTGSNEKIPTAAGLHAGEVKGSKCIFCEGNHDSAMCGKAKSLTLENRRVKVKEGRACFICLKVGHGAARCKSRPKCLICSRKHYELLCPELASQKGKSEEAQKNGKQGEQQGARGTESTAAAKATASNTVCTQDVLLCTQLVKVVWGGKELIVRALFDTGAQRSYIQSSATEALKMAPCGQELLVQQLFGGSTSEPRRHHRFQFSLKGLNPGKCVNIEALDQPKLCGQIPRLQRGPWLQELAARGIEVDGQGSSNPEVELLIGADQAGRLLTGKVQHLSCGLTACQTVFGWTVMGRLNSSEDRSTSMLVTSLLVSEIKVPELWKLEAIGIQDPIEVQSQEQRERDVLRQFDETVLINQEGRYEVGLPWILGHRRLPNNFEIAKKRLVTVTRKLKDLKLVDQYQNIFEEWKNEGIIEEVQLDEVQNAAVHYLPHRPVVKEESQTTPVRPVFDASCKSPGSPCLNDCLEKGPNLIVLLSTILLRFREHEIGLIADIRKAFLMISVKKEDRDSLLFLWWENAETGQVKVYRHCRVVFGMNCSPFLLGAVLQHFLQRAPEESKACAEKLQKSLYVDNCVASISTREEVEVFRRQSTELLAGVKLELRMWEDNALPVDQTLQEPTTVLGLCWDKVRDTLSCPVKVDVPEIVTKRAILSAAQRIFDPMGFLSPALLVPKMLLQESWSLKTGWDAELPEDIRVKFIKWVKELDVLSEVKIPRWMTAGTAPRDTWSLHTFCDASKVAYAAAVYLRCTTNQGVSIQLLQAKARVAPIKKSTIPRLELLACTIGSRLTQSVRDALGLKDVPSMYWSDSTTAIAWIQRADNWGVFVANRVNEILQLTKLNEWRHVPGTLNPADLPSRGCTPEQLLSSRWWEGPSWLRQDSSSWPSHDRVADEDLVVAEKRKSTEVLLQTHSTIPWYMERFSAYLRVVRLVAWVHRWSRQRNQKLVRQGATRELDILEIVKAEVILVRLVQQEVFKDENDLKGLSVIRDAEGILRVKSKITRRTDLHDFKYPMLLPSQHPMVDCLIRDTHLRNCHAGAQVIMTKLREKFWVIHSRKAIRRVIGKCQRCRRYDVKAMQTVPAPLPLDRVKDAACFEVTGIDLAGPLYVKDGSKVWIVLFTCAVYRAVHLELVSSLSTEGFLQSLRRFMARRGRPSVIFSDNGTNFSGSDNAFRALDWNRIKATYGVEQIQWKFSPPTAAWWGGWWERLIQMVKKLLVRVLGKAILHYEELTTVLCDVEATINARPLTYLSEDPDDLASLTPAMFLRGIPKGECPDIDKIESSGFESRFRYRQRLMRDLRARFRKEYLGMLVQRGHEKQMRPIQVGDVVLVGSENRKRLDWPLARVLSLHPGPDGHVRVVRVQTASGESVRPVQKLYHLEVEADEVSKFHPPSCSEPVVPQDVSQDEPAVKDVSQDEAAVKEVSQDEPEVKEVSQDDPEVKEVSQDESAGMQEDGQGNVVTRSGRKVTVPLRLGY